MWGNKQCRLLLCLHPGRCRCRCLRPYRDGHLPVVTSTIFSYDRSYAFFHLISAFMCPCGLLSYSISGGVWCGIVVVNHDMVVKWCANGCSMKTLFR
jgi:hypothetical protein